MSVNFWRHQRIRIWRKLDLNLRWAKISLNLWRITWQSQKRPLFILSIYSLQCTRNNRRLKQKKKKTVADKAGKLTTNTDNYLVDHKINPQHISRENVAVNLWRNTVDPSPGVNNRDCYHSSEPDFAPELMYASHSNDLYFAGRRTMQIFRCRFTSRIVSASFPSHFFTFSIPPTSTCRLLCYSFCFFFFFAHRPILCLWVSSARVESKGCQNPYFLFKATGTFSNVSPSRAFHSSFPFQLFFFALFLLH